MASQPTLQVMSIDSASPEQIKRSSSVSQSWLVNLPPQCNHPFWKWPALFMAMIYPTVDGSEILLTTFWMYKIL